MRMTSWQRPSGPLNVWKIIEGYEKLADGSKTSVKFSIQEIPNKEGRRAEVLTLMSTHFIRDEPTCIAFNIKDHPKDVECFQSFWKYQLDQGVVVGCYILDSEGKIKKLIGANLVHIQTDETEKDFKNISETYIKDSPKIVRIFSLMRYMIKKCEVRKAYNVDKFITSISLCVLPEFRGQKLGVHILEARSAIAQKYEIRVTVSIFTAHASQIQAKRAGFQEVYSLDYAEVIDDEGNLLFPNIPSKCAKVMMKQFP